MMDAVKFAVCTDLHYDIIPDGLERLETFLETAEREDVDFIIQLGDFCYPKEENRIAVQKFNSFSKPHYHVIGNHDDACGKEKTMAWLGMEKNYYSFRCNGFHFIVLDANYTQHENGCEKLYPAVPQIHPTR